MNKRKTIDFTIFFYVFVFFIISIITLYSTLNYLSISNLVLKQVLFYILGIFIIFFVVKIGNERLLKYSFYIYLINLVLLLVVLIFGNEINGTKAWIEIPLFGSLQPSEFMKIGLILFLAQIITKERKKGSSDFVIILKSVLVFLIPTILTFLEPDTGAVFVYFIITLVILFTSGIKLRWFVVGFSIILVIILIFSYFYFFKQNLFIEVLGSDFFYRFDRIIDWSNSSGMQLENSIIGISSSNLFGHGFNNIPIYFPELQTDFIFASYVSCFGLFGAILLIIFLILFDNKILSIAKRSKKEQNKLILLGIFASLLYQQVQNIAMTIGLLPITGITLPFISYGGSSLLSFLILIGIVINIAIEKE